MKRERVYEMRVNVDSSGWSSGGYGRYIWCRLSSYHGHMDLSFFDFPPLFLKNGSVGSERILKNTNS
jgi:hypothetical protein